MKKKEPLPSIRELIQLSFYFVIVPLVMAFVVHFSIMLMLWTIGSNYNEMAAGFIFITSFAVAAVVIGFAIQAKIETEKENEKKEE